MYPKPVSSLTLPIIFMLTLSTSFADENKTYVVSGIDDVTEIVVDEFGVPHIYAENHYDVFCSGVQCGTGPSVVNRPMETTWSWSAIRCFFVL